MCNHLQKNNMKIYHMIYNQLNLDSYSHTILRKHKIHFLFKRVDQKRCRLFAKLYLQIKQNNVHYFALLVIVTKLLSI